MQLPLVAFMPQHLPVSMSAHELQMHCMCGSGRLGFEQPVSLCPEQGQSFLVYAGAICIWPAQTGLAISHFTVMFCSVQHGKAVLC